MDPTEDIAAWARPLLRTMLDHWLSASLNENGLFHPSLDRQWRRVDADARTLVTQCRLLYNFCRGYEFSGEDRYAEAAHHGFAALETYFLAAPGRYRWAVSGSGRESDATPDSYGYAFCLLAQATAARVFSSDGFSSAARHTWQSLSGIFTDSHGGLKWTIGTNSVRDESVRSQNPMMHTFEALLALGRVDDTGEAFDGARRLLSFLGGLPEFKAGALVETYTSEWQPQPPERQGVIDLGHAFEWAYLLSDWHALTHDPGVLALGEKFLRTGMTWGLAEGGVRDSCDSNGKIVSSAKGLWQQCEAIRAVSRYATRHGQKHLDDVLRQMLVFFHRHFIDEHHGGVYVSPPGLGNPASLDKGNPWKLDYHTVNMCLELIENDPREQKT